MYVYIYIYIYIYGYNLFVILYTNAVLVWMIEYRHPLSVLYVGAILSLKDNGYNLLLVILIVDC